MSKIRNAIEKYCTMLTMSLVMLEVNDSLEGTPLYRQQLKHHCKGLTKELERIIETDLMDVADAARDEMYIIMNAHKDIAKLLASLKPECFPEALQLLQQYKKDYNESEAIRDIQQDTN
jgi:hypothetical protein